VLPTSPFFAGYKRFGNLTARQFLNNTTWFNQISKKYIYPGAEGFQNDTSMQPINGTELLIVDMLVDRFGSESSTFLAPSDTPYSQRSIPPSSFNTFTADHPNNYYQYKVLQNFTVIAGPIAGNISPKDYLYFQRNALNNFCTAWFAQPGQGTQYLTTKNISDLV
jgi:Tuberculosis necrotizing toxin